jgi:PiT family inorganic phosphate transporter
VLLMALLLLVLTLVLAAANGANDVSKGISTLFGSGVGSYRRAVVWGTLWTGAGALVAAFASQRLVATFNGTSVLANGSTSPVLVLAVAAGAIGWLVIATCTGLPVSTTHSLIGALAGAAILDRGMNGLVWGRMAAIVAFPLLLSPVLSILLMLALRPLFARVFVRANPYCLCVEQRDAVAALPNGTAALQPATILTAGKDCPPAAVGIHAIDSAHWLSAGATSFFRGLNDTPKIVALGAVAAMTLTLSPISLYTLVAAAMAAGALIGGFRVTRTLAQKVTPISTANGFAANLVTSSLVGLASLWSFPVSTTQVSTGAILGIGMGEGRAQLRWKMAGEILLAWLVTLPAAAVLAALTLTLIRVANY